MEVFDLLIVLVIVFAIWILVGTLVLMALDVLVCSLPTEWRAGAILGMALIAVLLLAGCAPYDGPACATCVGAYDLGLSSHRDALGLGQ